MQIIRPRPAVGPATVAAAAVSCNAVSSTGSLAHSMCCSGALGFQLLLLWIVFSGGSLLILPPTGGWTARAAPPRVRADAEQPGEETFPPLQSVSTCSRYDDVRLHCDTPQRVVVHEARFTSQLPLHELEQRCNHTDPGTYVKVLNGRHGHNCSEDIRSSVNQRCSGQHACLFSWTRDHVKDPEARARCKGEGIIHVAYRCVDFEITGSLAVTE